MSHESGLIGREKQVLTGDDKTSVSDLCLEISGILRFAKLRVVDNAGPQSSTAVINVQIPAASAPPAARGQSLGDREPKRVALLVMITAARNAVLPTCGLGDADQEDSSGHPAMPLEG